MSYTDQKAFVQRIFDTFNTHDGPATAALFAPDAVVNDVAIAHAAVGHAQIAALYSRHFAAIPDAVASVERMIADDHTVVAEWTIRGTHRGRFMGIPPTNRPVSMKGVSILRFHGGMPTADTRIWDVAGLLRQIGLLPSQHTDEAA